MSYRLIDEIYTMNNSPRYYDLLFKQRIVKYYLENQSTISLRFVANLFRILGDHRTVKRWCDRYDDTISSLEQRHRPERPVNVKSTIN